MQNIAFSKILTFILLFIILYIAYLVVQPFLSLLVTSGIVAIFLYPIFQILQNNKFNKSFSALGSIFVFLMIILLPLAFVLSVAIEEITQAYSYLQNRPEVITQTQAFFNDKLAELNAIGIPLSVDVNNAVVKIIQSFSGQVGGILALTGNMLLNFLLSLLITYFFLVNRDAVVHYLFSLSPFEKRHQHKLVQRMMELINGTVRGNLVVIVTQTVAGFVGFSIFKFPSPALLGFIYGLFSIIPNIGVLMIWIPAVVFLAITQTILTAIYYLLWSVMLNLIIDNYVAPKIIGGQTKLHQIVILISVLGGLKVFGLLGLILGPTIIAMAFVALDIYREKLDQE